MPYVPLEAIAILKAGGSPQEIVEKKVKNQWSYPASARTARRWALYFRQGVADPTATPSDDLDEAQLEVSNEDIDAVFNLIKNKPQSIRFISMMLDRSENTIHNIIEAMESAGYNLDIGTRQIRVSTEVSRLLPETLPGELINQQVEKVAFPSDFHTGSTAEQITNRIRFLNYCREQGVKLFAVPGDLTAGNRVYHGQFADLYCHTSESQEAALSRAIVPLPDEKWVILGGNHDWSWVKNSGVDLVWRFCQKHPNVYFLGYDQADVPLTDNTKIRLWHPSGGVPYAVSYRLQKGMESLAYERLSSYLEETTDPKIRVIAVGHLHIENSFQRGGILGFQAGCFEGVTSYLKRKGLHPTIGGYIMTLTFDDAGRLRKSVREWIDFPEIKNDYMNYDPIADFNEPDEVEVLVGYNGRV
jgi:biotin operon repressor